MWPTVLREHSASSLGTLLGHWSCLNIVPDTHSEPQTCQCGHVSTHHSPYIDMLHSCHGKLAWAFVSNGRAVYSISAKQAFYFLKQPGKYYVPQVGVRLVRMAYFRFYNFPKVVFVCPFRHTSHDNIAHLQSQRTWQTWTWTRRLQLPSKLCLMRLGLTEELLRTFSCPLLSLHLKWPLVFVIGVWYQFVVGCANFHKCLTKGVMNVKQIARECSGPRLGSYLLNAFIARVAYVSTLMSLQQHGQTRPH